MLQLFVEGQSIDLSPDSSITIEEESPIFDSNTIPGGYSFPFTLPVTPRNSRIFGFPQILGITGDVLVEKQFQLYHTGLLRASGTITITATSTEFEAFLAVSTGDFAGKIQDKLLKEVKLGGERTWEWLPEYKFPDSDFALPTFTNGGFYMGSKFQISFQYDQFRINAYENGDYYNNDDNHVYVICPYPFLSYVVAKVFESFGYFVSENILSSDPDFRDLVMYTIRDIMKQGYYEYDMTTSAGFDSNGHELFITTPVRTWTARRLTTFNLAESMPNMKISDFLLSLRNFLNLAFIIEGDSVRIIKRQNIITQQPSIDLSGSVFGNPSIKPVKCPGFKLEWMVDPDDAIWREEVFKPISGFIEFLKDPVANLEELAEIDGTPNEIRFVEDLNLYLRYEMSIGVLPDLEVYHWLVYSYGYQDIIQNKDGEAFSSSMAPFLMATPGNNNTFTKRCPMTYQKGAYMEETEEHKFLLRLFFYRGFALDKNGDAYPYASADNLDLAGEVIPGKNLEISLSGEYGVYNQLWKSYLDWWIFRKQVDWIVKDPSILSFSSKYVIGSNHYVLKKRSFTLTALEIIPSRCEFYLV